MTTSILARPAPDALKATNLSPLIGARIGLSKQELLSGKHAEALRDLLEQRGVLIFPQIHFTDDEQIAFTQTIGPFLPELQGDKVYSISLDKKLNGPSTEYLKGSLFWHIDGTMNKVPIGAAVLSMKVLPTWGGDTEFCNTYAAFEALPDAAKRDAEKLRVMHCMWNTLLYYTPEPSLEQLEEYMAHGEVELPLVWTHASGRKSLVLGNTAHHVIGQSASESAKTLHGLRDWATQPQFSYRHQWSLGDAVMWDNTGTMHRALPYDPDCGRLLHRTKTAGVEPIA